MYLIIRKVGEKQIPLKLYENIKQAYKYIKMYIEESTQQYATVHLFVDENNKRSILKQRWYTYYHDGTREEIGIRYIKLIRGVGD